MLQSACEIRPVAATTGTKTGLGDTVLAGVWAGLLGERAWQTGNEASMTEKDGYMGVQGCWAWCKQVS